MVALYGKKSYLYIVKQPTKNRKIMKNVNYLMIAISLLIFACKKEDIKPQPVANTTNTSQAEADFTEQLFNQKWTADTVDNKSTADMNISIYNICLKNPVRVSNYWQGDEYTFAIPSNTPNTLNEKFQANYNTKILNVWTYDYTILTLTDTSLVIQNSQHLIKYKNAGTW